MSVATGLVRDPGVAAGDGVELMKLAAGAAVILGPAMGLAYLLAHPQADSLFVAPEGHFYVVSSVALLAVALAAASARASARLGDARATFVALGLLAAGGLLLVHGLTTPGVLMDANPWFGLSARLALWSGALLVGLSSLNVGKALERQAVEVPRPLAMGAIVLLAAYGLMGVDVFPIPEAITLAAALHDSALVTVFGSTLALSVLGVAFVRYWRAYRTTGSPANGAATIGVALMAQAQVALMLSQAWHLSWWGYHALLLASFTAIMAPALVGWARGGSLTSAAEGLFVRDLTAQLERGFPESIRALLAALDARDRYARGHSTAVANLAVRTAQAMELPLERLRVLHQAALLHDIGKLAVPDALLNKPDPFDDEEVEHIRQHPGLGAMMLRDLPSLREEMQVVRHHHERVDGAGYPDGLSGEQIPIEARIIAVADVFDALTSDRSYRPAWTREEGLDYLLANTGTQFDPVCVAALVEVLRGSGMAGRRDGTESPDGALMGYDHPQKTGVRATKSSV